MSAMLLNHEKRLEKNNKNSNDLLLPSTNLAHNQFKNISYQQSIDKSSENAQSVVPNNTQN